MDYTIKKNDKIIFGKSFNQCLTDNLINKMRQFNTVWFNDYFDHPVDNLPENIREIRFGDRFNQLIDNLPGNLKILVLGSYFNQPIDFLPRSLKKLYFNQFCFYDHYLDNLPFGLEVIGIPGTYKKKLDNLPDSLEIIFIGVSMFNGSYISFHNSWEDIFKVCFSHRIQRFPSNLKKLYIFSGYRYLDDLREKLGDKLVVV